MTTIKEHIKTNLFNLSKKIDKLKDEELIFEIRNNLISKNNYSNEEKIFNVVSSAEIRAIKPEFYLKTQIPFQKNEINIISSKGGVGKSSLSIYILLKIKEEMNENVFAYLSEDSLGLTKSRIEIIKSKHNLNADIDILGRETRPKPFLQYNDKGDLVPSNFFFMFKRAMQNYSLIVIDPLIAFMLTNENSNIEARAFMNLFNNWAEEEDKTFIFLHHHNKENTIRGATDFINAARVHYILEKTESGILCKLEKQNSLPFFKEVTIDLFSHRGKLNSPNLFTNKDSIFKYDETIEKDTIFKDKKTNDFFENQGEEYEF